MQQTILATDKSYYTHIRNATMLKKFGIILRFRFNEKVDLLNMFITTRLEYCSSNVEHIISAPLHKPCEFGF